MVWHCVQVQVVDTLGLKSAGVRMYIHIYIHTYTRIIQTRTCMLYTHIHIHTLLIHIHRRSLRDTHGSRHQRPIIYMYVNWE